MADPRAGSLAQRQLAFVRATVGAGPAPEGVDVRWIEFTRRTLVGKRYAAVRRHYPVLTAALDHAAGPDEPLRWFTHWAREHAAQGGLPLRGAGDGLAFAAWLDGQGRLPREAGGEIGIRLLAHRRPVLGGPVAPRGWWGIGTARCAGCVVVGLGSARRPRRVKVFG